MKVGLIGTGLMGLPMAQRLLAAQIPLAVYNRTAAKLEPLRDTEAYLAATPVDVLQQSDTVILMLTNAEAIRQVLFSDEARSHLSDRTMIQMGTIAPDESRSLRDDLANLGANYLEAPVLGSIPEANAGKLLVMVGASAEQFHQWLPLLQNFGPEPVHIGEVGTAAALKLALNQLIASLTTAFALSLNFAQKQGVDIEVFMQFLRQSALYAPTFDKKLQRMLEHNYENPNFPTKHMLKDANLFLASAGAVGLNADNLAGACKILERACEMGFADADYSALAEGVSPTVHPDQPL